MACGIVAEKIWKVLENGDPSGNTVLGYTHAGNPLSTATGVAVLSYIRKNGLVERSAEMGKMMMEKAKSRLAGHPHVGDIRGKGLHMAVELVKDRDTLEMYPADVSKAEEAYNRCMDNGLNLCPVHGDADGARGDSLIIKPAFTILEEELDELFEKLGKSLDEVRW